MSEKTELPTPRRLEKARAQGQVPRSRLFTSSWALLGGLCGLALAMPAGTAALRDFARSLLSVQAVPAAGALRQAVWLLARSAAPTLALAALGGGCAAVLCSGAQWNPARLLPQLARLDPWAGLGRVLGPSQWGEAGKALVVAAALVAAIWGAVAPALRDSLRGVALDGVSAAGVEVALLRPLVQRLALTIALLGAVDYGLARRKHRRALMMTRDEVRQEHKQSEGDPHHKSARKAEHRRLASGGPARGVAKATVVVVNPTHVAVGLRYAPGECEAPYLVARGREEDALRIRREAERRGVPVVRDVPLARSLVHYDVGEEIPEELYKAAAAVLKAVARREPPAGPGQRGPP